FGISRGRPTIGTVGIKRPTLKEIKVKPGEEYRPITKIETSIMGTRKALKEMGATEADIMRVEATWGEAVPKIARKKAPVMDAKELLYGSQRLTARETAIIIRQAIKNAKQVESVYGSSTIRPQLKAELRNWRKWNDIDIQTTMTADEVTAFTKDILNALKRAGSKVKLDAKGNIVKLVKGKWEKLTDIHAKDAAPGSVSEKVEGGWGYLFAEKPIKIKVPGVGEIRIMTLSETGLRKADAITRFTDIGRVPKGRIGRYTSDKYAIEIVAKGEKPIALVLRNVANKLKAKVSKLETRIDPVDSQFMYVYKNNKIGLRAVERLSELELPGIGASKKQQIIYHIEMGKVLGYN
ncbi:hypothetical protein KA005_26620, partial [bacterium]|nr:hypothetical protein [bacterium]